MAPRTGTARPLILGEGWSPDRPGGLNRYVRDLFDGLADGGVTPRAIVTGPAEDAPPAVRVAAAHDAPLGSRLWRYARAAKAEAVGCDVVDVHFALYGAACRALGGFRGRPVVVHFHGPWADESVAAGERSWAAVAAKRRLERAVYRRADDVVVLSGAFRQLLVERYGVAPWRVHVVPPGVDLERFTARSPQACRARLGLDAGAKVAVSVRRLVPRMGLDVLLAAWETVAAQVEEAVLLVAGDGPDRGRLEALVGAAGLEDRVRFVGGVSDDELVDVYGAADVCVVPSTALEGFGLVVLESLACGTPVVVTDVGGLPEAVAGLDREAIVPPDDPSALAARLGGVLGGTVPVPSPDACRRHAQRCSWDTAVERHRAIYDGARDGRSRTATRPRVVYLGHCAELSGGELALLRLLPALDVDAHVVLAEDGPLVNRLRQRGISVEVLPLAPAAAQVRRDRVRPGRLPLASAAQTAAYVARLAARLRALRPDVVHTNSLKAALYGGLAARLAGVPCVWHIRDRVSDDYLPAAAARLVRAAARRLPAAVIANSAATLAALELAGDDVPTWVVHDPYHPERHGRGRHQLASTAWSPGPLRVGMVGRLAPWKGQDVFLDAFARAFPDGGAQGVVVGSPMFGEDAYAGRLHRLADELGLADRVRFAGFVEDVEGELASLDVLVHASVIPEPFGQVVVEGMAAGLPVVAPSAGGPAEVLTHERDGLLYPPGDRDALAAALTRLAGDEELRSRLGTAGLDRARAFEPPAIAAQVMAVYQALTAGAASGAQRSLDITDGGGAPSADAQADDRPAGIPSGAAAGA